MQCTQQPDVEDFKVSKGVQYQVKKNLDIKFRYFEKATKFEKNLPLVLTKQLFYSVASKQVGDFFKF